MRTISIIGSGGMAAVIAQRTAEAGLTVEVISRNPSKAQALAEEDVRRKVGAFTPRPRQEILWFSAVPYSGAAAVVADYGAALAGVDASSTSPTPVAPTCPASSLRPVPARRKPQGTFLPARRW